MEQVVDAVVASPAWDKTLLLVVYDEHGGFYDHVPPSQAARVSPELPIDTHGLRVPAFVISPWVPGGGVFGSDTPPARSDAHHRQDLHFDHTSILKTIARRFLSSSPPYLGARYAIANDLSAVVTATKQNTQFRPFLRYHFEFGASSLVLGVKDGNPAPDAELWQLPADGSAGQVFSFEGAGDGLFFIRSRLSNLYLTALVPPRVPVEGIPVHVVQRAKVVPPADVIDFPAVARQKWALTPVTGFPGRYLVHCAGVAGLFLQPTNLTTPSAAVLRPLNLRTPVPDLAWTVTSPALAAG